MDFDWKKMIGTAAPMLATALGGPFAGAAVAAIGEAFGLGADATDAEIAKKLATASPETLLQLKKAEQDFTARMAELGYKSEADLAKIAAEDRDSARKREAATGDWTPRILAFLLVGGALGMGAGLLFGELTVDNTLAGVVIGYLFNEAGGVTSYYFGESKKGYKVEGGGKGPAS